MDCLSGCPTIGGMDWILSLELAVIGLAYATVFLLVLVLLARSDRRV
jgi:hypothetical protein